MVSQVVAFYLTCLFLGITAQTTTQTWSPTVHIESRFVSVKAGETLTLQCSYDGHFAVRFYWYKHSLGKELELISNFYMSKTNTTFYGEFNDNPRFRLDSENGKNHLMITDLRVSDSATYYCIQTFLYTLKISGIITVSVEGSGSNIKASVHQSASETVQPGDSVTLSCTVHTGTCDGEHSVYWFKNQQEEESPPGLIYTHGGRSDQCERKPDTQTHTCVYNLPMKSLNLSHAGTYYCAVASCGQILFGDGTKLDFQDEVDWVAYFWRGAFAFNFILSVLLAFSICMMNKRSSCLCAESQAGSSLPTKGNQHAENIYYAALSVNLTKRSRNQRDPTWSECVYHSIKQ